MELDMNMMMNLAKSMQGTFAGAGEKVKEKLKLILVSVSVGGGAICIQMNGLYEVTQMDMKSEILSPEDKPMLQDLLILAFNQASAEVKIKQKEVFTSMGIPVDMLGGLI